MLLLLVAGGRASALEVSGRLRAAGGTALAGAHLELVPVPDGAERGRLLAAGAVNLPAVAAAESDAAGRYRLEAPGPGLWGLVVRADGYVPMVYDLVPLVEAMEVPQVTLLPDAGAMVRVLDPRGRPVSGARVRGRGAGDPVWEPAREAGWSPVHPFVQTRADGRARLPRAEGAGLALTAWAPPWVETSGEVTAEMAAKAEEEPLVRLREGVERVVEVRTPGGAPVAGASVVVGGPRGLQAGTTDREGRLRVRALAGEPVELVVAAEGELRGRFRLTPREPPGAETEEPEAARVVPLEVSAELPLRGRVIDALDGRPVAGAVVWNREAPGQWASSGDDGVFELAEPPGEGVPLRAAAAGYLPSVLRLRWTAQGEVWPLALTPVLDLTGRVVEPSGAPVAGALVETRPARDPTRPEVIHRRNWEVRSDDDGRFRCDDLPAGPTYELRFTAPGHAPALRVVAGGRRAVPQLRVVLDPGAILTGQVVRATGEPAAGAEVRVMPERDNDGRRHRTERTSTATTDAEGRFTVGDLVADLHVLHVRAARAPLLTRSGVEVTAGTVSDLGVLRLQPDQALSGRVVDGDGAPVAGAEVQAWPSAARSQETTVATTSEPDGTFRLPGLAPGRPVDVEVAAAHGQRVSLRRVVPDPQEPLEVVLPAGAEVFGRLVGEDGEGVAGPFVTVWVWSPEEDGGGTMERRFTATDEDGAFRLAGLPPGRVKLEASHGSRAVERELAEPLRPGEQRGPLELVLPDGAPLAGRVLRADGTPAVGARVAVRMLPAEPPPVTAGEEGAPPWRFQETRRVRSVATGSSGGFTMPGVRPGAVEVTCDLGRDGRARWRGTVEPEGTWVELRVEPQLYVAGRVRDAAGRPLVATVWLLAVDGTVPPLTATADVVYQPGGEPPYRRGDRSRADGTFFIGDLPPGRYALSAEAAGFVPYAPAERLQVGPEPVDGLDVRLSSGAAVTGRLFGVAPEEVGEVQIYASSGDAFRHHSRLSADGRFRIAGLTPGEWRLAARMPRTGRETARTFEVHAGDEELEIDLDLGRGLILDGELRVEGGVPPEARVFLSRLGDGAAPPEQGPSVSVPLLGDGSFRVEGLVPGRYALVLGGGSLGDGPPFALRLDLSSDRTLVEDFAAGGLEGRVVDPAGPPIAGAEVRLVPVSGLPAGQPGARTFSGEDGGFAFPLVPPGRWRVEAVAGARRGVADVVISRGTSVVEVTVP